ncbi:MAG: hypothetical protein JSU58_11490 [Dehalococcoidales bacterium]|nr:MAG: hypothetical protein JSU58_11490 [Dehalococcoidales bacterium]
MELTYENIQAFVKEYFNTYSTVGQFPDTADEMHKYFAPDLRFIPYIAGIGGPEGGFRSADQFIQTAKNHPKWYERLIPDDITIDERRAVFVALFRMEVVDAKTDEIAIKKSALAHYQLALDENKDIKIKKILFFWETLPEGQKEFYDLFGPDSPTD